MNTTIHTLFQLAAKFFYRKYRENGGSLDELAAKIGITPTYLSAVVNGSRVASLDLHNRIANALYGPYDKFIAVGRKIAEGKEPPIAQGGEQPDDIEKILVHLTHLVKDHQQVSKKMAEQERRLRDFSKTCGDIFFELDDNFRLTYVSGPVEKIIGLPEDDLLGEDIRTLYTESEWNYFKPLIDNAIRNRQVLDTVIKLCRNGKIFYRHCTAKPVFDSTSSNFSGFRGTYRDVTRGKILENKLMDEMSLFQGAIDFIREHAIVITDKHNKIVRWNKTYQKMMGLSGDSIDNSTTKHSVAFVNNQFRYPEKDKKGIVEFFPSRGKMVNHLEMKNGKTIKRTASPLYRDGSFTGQVMFFSDTTG